MVANRTNRRWLSYSTRTLLIAVALCCVGLNWLLVQVATVNERAELRRWAALHGTWNLAADRLLPIGGIKDEWALVAQDWRTRSTSGVPWVRRMLGDEPVEVFVLWEAWRQEPEAVRIEKQFPEAAIGFRP
jgi:hypothetical protein